MLLAIDVGNTNIVLGAVKNNNTIFTSRIHTDKNKTEDEYAVIFRTLIEIHNCSLGEFDGAIISSVVPQLNEILKKSVKMVINCDPLTVGPGLKTGLNIKIDNPATLGSDIVVGCVAALAYYPKPLIVIDMGTATTVVAIDKNGVYRGGVICPGVRTALQSLTNNTAQLPDISLDTPKKTIGTNTADCMRRLAVCGGRNHSRYKNKKIQQRMDERS